MKKLLLRLLVSCTMIFSSIVIMIGGNGAASAVIIEYTADSACRLFSGDGLWHYCYLIDNRTSDSWHNYTGPLSGSIPWGSTNLSWSITTNKNGFKINLPNLPSINEIFTMTSFGDGDAANCETYGVKWVAVGKSTGYGVADVRGYFPRAIRCNEVKKKIFNLTYDANGGTGAPGRQSCTTAGSSCNITMSNNRPTRTGYDFLGWADTKNSEKKYDPGKTITLSSNKTVYAVWKLKRLTLTAYAVTESGENLNNGNAIGSKTVNYGSGVSVNKTDISGFTFLGWRLNKTNGAVTSGDAYTVNSLTANTNVYAVYRGFSAVSSLNINVKNESVGAYGEYAKTIYAKPGDKTNFKIDYNPAAQGAYSFKLKKIQIDSGGIKTSDGNTILGTVFNQNKGNLGNWNNAFEVSGAIAKSYNYGLGDASSKTESNNPRVVSAEEVGKTLKAVASTNKNDSSKTTPKGVQVVANGGNTMGKVDTTALSSEASIIVPYNFSNTISLSDERDKLLFAGEDRKVSALVKVGKRTNGILEETYVTKADGVKWKITIEYKDSSGTSAIKDFLGANYDSGNSLEANADSSADVLIEVPDLPAGTKVSLRAAVYPKDSKDDNALSTNLYDENDTNSWSYSNVIEYTIAKRPTLQVWGGNVYSNGNIKTSIADKRRLNGVAETNEESHYIFGSWAELGIIANGSVTGFASGAGYGYNNDYVDLSNHRDGFNFCNVSTLSFANSGCRNKSTGGLESNAITNKITNDQESIIKKLFQTTGTTNEIGDVLKTNSLDELKISNSGITAIDGENGTLNINGNIEYIGSYNSLEAIPKVVIHAKNITIACNVARIDALLIADEDVKTCNSDDENEENRSQLRINGAIIAKRLIANRTYGAGTGANSGDPAEVINFDPSLYLWGMKNSDETSLNKSNNIDTVYIRELAPRY